MVGFNPGLASLSARPPTPPKESSSKLANGNDPRLFASSINRPPLDTPDESPSSSAENFKSSAEKAQKKVGFSPWTEFHRPPGIGGRDSDSEGSIRRLPPSKECKSLKSILKTCKDNTTAPFENELVAFDQTNLATMLRSTIQNLTNAPQANFFEAYSSLLAGLGAYDDVPETTDLSVEVVELTGYIRRDVSVGTTEADGSLETQLAAQALKVVTVFLCFPSIAALLPEDFCSFILDRCLSGIEDAGSPKILVTHYMHLLEREKFSPKLMTTDRVGRLLTALDSVTTRVKGNRIVCHRLMIYQHLLIKAKSVMAVRVRLWIDHLVSGMMSSIRDFRVRAIGFGVEAGLELGTIKSVSQSCIEVFNRAMPEGTKVIDFLSSRLLEMVGSKEDGVHVPQIWSVVILFLRGRRRQLECWEHFKAWLVIIQRCLNSSDPHVKFQANIAWSRLIFVVNLDTSTSISMAKALRQPIVSQLERKSGDKSSRDPKQIARSTYCTLLYYAFRPTTSPAQLDQYWDLYVTQILPISFAASKSDVNHACDILAALLSSDSKPRIWNGNRANLSGSVKPDELPCIDPKWIRSRAANVIQVFTKLSDVADWQPKKDHEAPLLLAWRSFMAALGAASSKEVKVSMDTMSAVSQIIDFLKRLLERGNQQLSDGNNRQQEAGHGCLSDKFGKFGYMTQEAVAAIGGIPFLERRVVMTSHNSFEAAETPSSRSTRDSGSLNSPIMHLLNLLLTQVQIGQPPSSYVDAVKSLIHVSLQTATPKRTQLGALRNLARLLSGQNTFDRHASLAFWALLADATCSALKFPRLSDSHNASPQYPGQDYREAVKILEVGIQNRFHEINPAWHELYNCVVLALQSEAGNDAIVLIVTEPLAAVVKDATSHCCLLVTAATLVNSTCWVKSQQQMERTQKLLWGVTHVSHKPRLDRLPSNLLNMIDALLDSAYLRSNMIPAESIMIFLSSVTNFIGSCPSEHCERMLSRTHSGIAAWIEDRNEGMSLSNDGLRLHVDKLWAKVVTAIEEIRNYDTRLLFSLQHILEAGFRSRWKTILNRSVTMWNHTFGCAPALEYPEALRKQLLKLRCITSLSLPTITEVEGDEVMSSPISFNESQNDEFPAEHPLPVKCSIPTGPSCLSHSDPNAPAARPRPRTDSEVPLPVRREHETTPNTRLRHDDSQIQFAAIESSPLAGEPLDSQQLTDRQKEVKERQVYEVAMFPEIGSSPNSALRHTEYSLPKLRLKSNYDLEAEMTVDEQTSPAHPPDVAMTDFHGSSPTPTSSKRGASSTKIGDRPLSSPPLPPSRTTIDQQIAVSETANKQAEPPMVHQEYGLDDIDTGVKSPAELGWKLSDKDSAPSEAPLRDTEREDALIPNIQANRPEDHILSGSDVFVDALGEPIDKVSAAGDANETSKFPNPAQIGDAFHPITEDDQVTAQLVSEMERASSQRSSKQDDAMKSVTRSEKKRRSNFSDTDRSNKRVRSDLAPTDQQQVSETPQVMEFAECVLINVRSAEGKTQARPHHIKRERSQSPCSMATIPAERELPVARHRRGRPLSTRHTYQTSQENLSPSGNRTSARKSSRLRRTSISSPRHPEPAPLETGATSPELVTKTGRRRASKRWFWIAEGSQDDDNQVGTNTGSESAIVRNPDLAVRQDRSSSRHKSGQLQQSSSESVEVREVQTGDIPTSKTQEGDKTPQVEATDASISGDSPTADGILQGFKKMLGNIKRIALGREEEREMIGVLFESVKEIHEAGRRNTAM